MSKKTRRRPLRFETLDQVISETQQLLSSGYAAQGNWTLGQICRHLALTYDACIDGYPRWMSLFFWVRPILRRIFLAKLMEGKSPEGIRTAPGFVPPANSVDAVEVAMLEASIARFHSFEGKLHPHPGFGRLSKQEWEQFHAMHAAHHLGFLSPNPSTKSEACDDD